MDSTFPVGDESDVDMLAGGKSTLAAAPRDHPASGADDRSPAA